MAKSAGIVLIGNEILSGKVTDANAAYLCRELRQLGVDVRRITVIPDEVELIAATVAEFSRLFDLVFTSGASAPPTTTSPWRASPEPSRPAWFVIPR